MDGHVDAAGEQRLLELLYEDASLADLAERPRAVAVAGRRHRHQRHLCPTAPQHLRRTAGLRHGEPAAARADPYERGSSERSSSPNRCRTASAYTAPSAPAAASFRRTVGRCRSLLTMPLVTDSTTRRSFSESRWRAASTRASS